MPTEASICKIQIGEFRNVDPDSLAFAFDALKSNDPQTQNCQLEIKMISAEAICQSNHHSYHPAEANFYACTICGDGIGKLISGQELEIASIIMETVQIETMDETRKA
jgi:Zn finger protein HypA/HybF involved in hydrogenase expression